MITELTSLYRDAVKTFRVELTNNAHAHVICSPTQPLPLQTMETKKWLSTKSREELRGTLGWGVPPVISSKEVFSVHHPMIPTFYVPAWQLDMQNRRNIIKVWRFQSECSLYQFSHSVLIQNCELAGNPLWRGHVSYFLNGRGNNS